MSQPCPLVPKHHLNIAPIASADLLTPRLGVYYPVHSMLGPSKRVDFELTFAPSALEALARVNAEVDLEHAHVVLPDSKRYPFFPDWRDHTWAGYTWMWHPNDPGNRRGFGIRYGLISTSVSVQWRARRHGIAGILGNRGIVESATYRI